LLLPGRVVVSAEGAREFETLGAELQRSSWKRPLLAGLWG